MEDWLYDLFDDEESVLKSDFQEQIDELLDEQSDIVYDMYTNPSMESKDKNF